MPSLKKFNLYQGDHIQHQKDVLYSNLELPNFPIRIVYLDHEYLRDIFRTYINPILESYDFEIKVDDDYEEFGSQEIAIVSKYSTIAFSIFSKIKKDCRIRVDISQGLDGVDASIYVTNCSLKEGPGKVTRFTQNTLEFLDQLQYVIGKIINQIAYDANYNANLYKSVLRNGTNKFLGPAEDLVKQYLGKKY